MPSSSTMDALLGKPGRPLPAFIAAELLCAFQLVVDVGLPLFEDIMGPQAWALLFTLIPAWGVVAWSWRAGRRRSAWLGAAVIVGAWIWTIWDSLRWWNANMAP